MNPASQRTVVLAGGGVKARHWLAAKLQQSLLGQSLFYDFFCPDTPLDLVHTPANGRHLLWKNPQDTSPKEWLEDWRFQLHSLQRNYQSLHAGKDTVVEQAVYALVNGQVPVMQRPELTGRWQGVCECCADPACEQKLFGRLLQN